MNLNSFPVSYLRSGLIQKLPLVLTPMPNTEVVATKYFLFYKSKKRIRIFRSIFPSDHKMLIIMILLLFSEPYFPELNSLSQLLWKHAEIKKLLKTKDVFD